MNRNLLIRIYSFSYLHNEPIGDPTGNGGGFVFDCRGLPNPGRIKELAQFTGFDPPILDFFSENRETLEPFIERCAALVSASAHAYVRRGFSDLQVAFGCTGGRHRSVYCANALKEYLTKIRFTVMVVHWNLEQTEATYRTRRAMILAAGFGTRLHPLTDSTPKALVEAGGKPMLDWCAEALLRAGCRELVVNAHHFAGQIETWVEQFGAKNPSIALTVSNEETILGTGGGIRRAARYLHAPEPILIHNGDIFTDFDLNTLYATHNASDDVTLVCQDRPASSHLLVDADNRLCGLTSPKIGERTMTHPHGKIRRLGFTGIHLVSSRWL